MRRSSKFLILGIAAVASVAATGVALANHGKAGLWSVSISMGGGVTMPDLSQAPPEIQARMRAMGLSAHGNTMTVEHCMTPQEVAIDAPPRNEQNRDCTFSNLHVGGGVMTADMICKGRFTGTGHMQFTYDSATHYVGEMKMEGQSEGTPMNQDQKFEGHWISADCGSINH